MSPPPRHVTVVCNPTKAVDPARRRRQVVAALTARGLPEPHWLETTVDDPGEVMGRAAVKDGTELVVACGGDGTVAACVAAVAGTGVPLAIIPTGTGNLLARNLDLPLDLGAAAAVAAGGRRRRLDVGVTEDGRRFAVMAGIGFDAAMLRDAPETLKARLGWLAYVVSGLRNVRNPPYDLDLVLDGAPTLHRRGAGVLVGNVGRLQAGLAVLPDARPDDGVLDVAVLSPRSLRGWARLAGRLVLRRPPAPVDMETFRARAVAVTARRPLPVELDGEYGSATTRLAVAVEPGALLVCVP